MLQKCTLVNHEKFEHVSLFRQVFKQNLERLALWLLHIVDKKGLEVTGHNPSWTLGIRQFRGIALGLLKRSEKCAVRLLDRRFEVFVNALLLYHHMSGFDIGIDE